MFVFQRTFACRKNIGGVFVYVLLSDYKELLIDKPVSVTMKGM
jgi:hypothetical protein